MKLETFFEKFDQFADAPDAVAKMRELVLQLAVRGQLVPQNPQEEPASKAIERLVALNGSGAPAKLFAGEELIEPPFEIPGSWEWVRFGDLVRIRTGKLDANAAVEGGVYPFFTCSKTPSQIATYSFDTSAVILAGNGDFNLKSYSGKFDAYQRTYVIEPLGWELGFCFWLVSAQIKRITDNQRGSAIPYLRLGDIANPLVPFPPLAEQKRIVAKVDELMALCDRLESQQRERETRHAALARASLARFAEAPTPANLHFIFHKSYDISPADLRKSILTLAVQGKLVAQDPKDEPSDDALRKCGLEVNRWSVGGGEIRHDVPSSWTWIRFAGVGEQRLGKMLDAQKNRGEAMPYLRNTNVQWMHFELDDLKEMRLEEREKEDLRLRYGDLLICEGGEPGRCAIWRDEVSEMYFQKALHRVRPSGEILAEFLALNLQVDCRNGVLAGYFTGATIKHLTGQSLSEYPVPIPPLAEQRRIVAKADQLMTLVDRLETQLAASRAIAKNLLNAVVAELTGAK